MKLRSELAALVAGLVLPAAAGAQTYAAFDLGSLAGRSTSAYAINAIGQVVGGSEATPDGFVWPSAAFITDADGIGMTRINSPGSLATAVNGSGQTVGYGWPVSHPNVTQWAFITGPNGVGVTNLTAPWAIQYILAYGINADGQVAGYAASQIDAQFHAFITGADGVGMVALGTLGGSGSYGYGINDSGQVVGYSGTADGLSHAFITGADGAGMTDLGTLGGGRSYGYGINNSGQVVGYAWTADGLEHAFVTGANGAGMIDLGTLGGSDSTAYGLNASGMVVGSSQSAEGRWHAFATGADGAGMVDLNSLVTLADGAYLTEARGINDSGQIVANGSNGHAYLLSPVPEPEAAAMMLAGLALIGTTAWCRKQAISRDPAPK